MQMKRIIALLLSAIMLAFALPQRILAVEESYYEDPSVIWQRTTGITSSVRLTESVFDNGARQAEHYISYRPGSPVLPRLRTGATLREKLTYDEAVNGADGRVLACLNGDYFVMRTGMPLGLVVRDGELLASDAGNYAFGFQEDGTAILGMPALQMRVTAGFEQFRLSGINKDYKTGENCLFTPEWGSQAALSEDVRCITLFPDEESKLRIGGEMIYIVDEIFPGSEAVDIPKDRHLLCLQESDYQSIQSYMTEGSEVSVVVKAEDTRFIHCETAVGCLYRLLNDGDIEPNLDKMDRNQAPRTAIGIRSNGTVIFYTVDGRQSGYATGLTLRETAERLADLGCVEAGVLDGGASTVLGAQLPGSDECTIVNSPSLGEPRETPQYLLLEAPATRRGKLDCIAVYPEEKVVLCGSKCIVTCAGTDQYGATVDTGRVSWEADEGYIRTDGSFFAPDEPCVVNISAERGDLIGTTQILVIDEPDSLRLQPKADLEKDGTLKIRPGEEVELSVIARWKGLPVGCTEGDLSWNVTGGIGKVSKSTFTAADQPGNGRIRVSAGDASAEISVSVTDKVFVLDGFERVSTGRTEGLRWMGETLRDRVKYGKGSLRLDYDLQEGSAVWPMDGYETELLDYLSFWVRSDGSGLRLYSVHEEGELLLGTLDSSGWMQFTVDTALNGALLGLKLVGSGSGTLWVDQLLLRSDPEADVEAPVVRIAEENGVITGEVWDRAEGFLPADRLTFTVDGTESPFKYSADSGSFRAELSDSRRARHVVLTASDKSGNYHSAAILLSGKGDSDFPDMKGHWAASYVDYLSSRGVVNGKPDEEGRLIFDPNSMITRAEFSVMLCRWLGLETSGSASRVDFADAADIPVWALDSVRAVVAAGLIQGAAAADGVYFMPKQPLTRAQAAVILGRTMEGGRMMADLPYPDAGDIPDWAVTYASELAFMGVMQGDETGFHPGDNLTRAQAAKLLSELT